MAEISTVFNQPKAAFTFLPAGIKYPPVEKEWQKKGHTYHEATAHKGNVGIMAGNSWLGLDQDVPAAFDNLELPITTMWETRPGRLGLWFVCNDNGNRPEILEKIGKKSDQAQLKLFKDGKPIGEIKLQRSYQLIPPFFKFIDQETGKDVAPGPSIQKHLGLFYPAQRD